MTAHTRSKLGKYNGKIILIMNNILLGCTFFASIVAIESLLSGTLNAKIEFEPQYLRLNQIQSIGTHNSYHIKPAPNLTKAMLKGNWLTRGLLGSFKYTHYPLSEQFDMGIRQIELDMFLDPEGGLYAEPVGDSIVEKIGLPADPDFDPNDEMLQPGLKVLHTQDIDYRSLCLTFIQCLEEIKTWSDNHPQHFPIMVLIEAKDKALPRMITPEGIILDFTTPIEFDASNISEIDQEINAVFPREQLITPDDIRGKYATLKEAIMTDGWPTLAESQGKIIFVMDNRNDLYLKRYPGLKGATLFASAQEPGTDEGMFINTQEPTREIRDLVRQGYIVRTRADRDTIHARVDYSGKRDRAINSGAQYISTDYHKPNEYFSDFMVLFADDTLIRCNPLNTSENCRIEDRVISQKP